MDDSRRVDAAFAFRDAPFEIVAAGFWRNGARVEHRCIVVGAHLIGEFAFLAMLDVHAERRFFQQALHR